MSAQTPSVVEKEPVLVYQSVAILVVLIAGFVGVVIDPATVVTVIVSVVALVAAVKAAIKARSKVTPVIEPSA